MGGLTAVIGALGILTTILTLYLTARKLPSDTATASVDQAAKLLAEREKYTDDLREDYERMRTELKEVRDERNALQKLVDALTLDTIRLGRMVRKLGGDPNAVD